MKYLMIVMTEQVEDGVDGPDDIERWVEAHDASGEREFGDRLADASEARTVRVRASGPRVEHGTASPAHAAIAGIDLLECESLDRAVEIALDHPMARLGVIEVRPFYDWDADEQ